MSRDMLEELYGQPGFVPVYGFSLYSPFRLGFIGNQPFSTLFFLFEYFEYAPKARTASNSQCSTCYVVLN